MSRKGKKADRGHIAPQVEAGSPASSSALTVILSLNHLFKSLGNRKLASKCRLYLFFCVTKHTASSLSQPILAGVIAEVCSQDRAVVPALTQNWVFSVPSLIIIDLLCHSFTLGVQLGLGVLRRKANSGAEELACNSLAIWPHSAPLFRIL